jgi:hypothetical protein
MGATIVVLLLCLAALVEHLYHTWPSLRLLLPSCCGGPQEDRPAPDRQALLGEKKSESVWRDNHSASRGIICLIVKIILPLWVLASLIVDVGDMLAYQNGFFSPPYNWGVIWLLDFLEIFGAYCAFCLGSLLAFFWSYLLDLALQENIYHSFSITLMNWSLTILPLAVVWLILSMVQACLLDPAVYEATYLTRIGIDLVLFLLLDLWFALLCYRWYRVLNSYGEIGGQFARRLLFISFGCMVLYTFIAVESFIQYWYPLWSNPDFTTYWVIRNIFFLVIPALLFLYAVAGRDTFLLCRCRRRRAADEIPTGRSLDSTQPHSLRTLSQSYIHSYGQT